uniref:Uncharacterized protein n=1 Tax=Utricularia reniformis TaxID=192314 RepID=A0A1Y0B1D3_9LAMI|nr:hypothetical protein AEK19_MT0948 [Utricularia reniformis]ART31173.1 hypothetical protein AEK19_MT0948 [Utricularia reniformis]
MCRRKMYSSNTAELDLSVSDAWSDCHYRRKRRMLSAESVGSRGKH